MKNLQQHIIEKLKIDKNTKIKKYKSTEDVLIFENLYCDYTATELSLFITGLNRVSEDNNDCKDVMVLYENYDESIDYYKFNKDINNKEIKIAKGDVKEKICELIVYPCNDTNENYMTNIVDNIIDTLTYWNKEKHRQYFKILADGGLGYFKKYTYIYVWYSSKYNCINIMLSNRSYESLRKEEKFI